MIQTALNPKVLAKSKITEIDSQLNNVSDLLNRFRKTPANDIYSLHELALLNEVSPEFMVQLLLCFDNTAHLKLIESEDFDQFSIPEVLQYLYKTHEFYKTYRFRKIERLLYNCIKLTSKDNNLIDLLFSAYSKMKTSLLHHMATEENVLFPYAEEIHKQLKGYSPLNQFFANRIPESFDHSHEDELNHDIFNVCTLFVTTHINQKLKSEISKLDQELKNFQTDLTIHAWIEEQVLIPKLCELKYELYHKELKH